MEILQWSEDDTQDVKEMKIISMEKLLILTRINPMIWSLEFPTMLQVINLQHHQLWDVISRDWIMRFHSDTFMIQQGESVS